MLTFHRGENDDRQPLVQKLDIASNVRQLAYASTAAFKPYAFNASNEIILFQVFDSVAESLDL
jgi:hypothetical protein